MDEVLELYFLNEEGKKFRLTVDSPRADITGAEVKAVMDSIVADNIFNTSGGDLLTPHEARKVTKQVQYIDLP